MKIKHNNPAARSVVVVLNGRVMSSVVEANEEEGYIIVLERDDHGNLIDEIDDKGIRRYREKRLEGRVTVWAPECQLDPAEPRVEGARLIAAESQPEYDPIPIVITNNMSYPHSNEGYNTVVMRFVPTKAQRELIAAGMDVYVQLLTFGQPQQPIIVQIGTYGI